MQRTSTEVNVYMRRHTKRALVGNVLYHKFSHGDVFYRFNREFVNVMLELCINHATLVPVEQQTTVVSDAKVRYQPNTSSHLKKTFK